MARLLQTVSVLGFLVGCATQGGIGVGVANADQWVKLGERVVNDRLDHDSLSVTGSRGDFEALKFVVRRRPVHFLDVKVHYANGDTQDVSLRAVIPAGGESRVIDLKGGDRVIRTIEFWYEAESARRGRRATIEVFGRR